MLFADGRRWHERKGDSSNKRADAGFLTSSKRRGAQYCSSGPVLFTWWHGTTLVCWGTFIWTLQGGYQSLQMTLLLQHPDYTASLEGAGRVFSTQCWCASSLLCFALSDNYHAHYPKVWKQTKQKTHREEMQSHFRWCLDVSILCESSHVTKLSRSHLKSFQFVNKKSFQRSHLHNAYGYSYIKVEGYPTFFLLMPCIQS